MDKIRKMNADEFRDIASKHPFNMDLLTKDHYLTLILYLLKDVGGIYFKGGTALQKTFLDYARLSEDADYTVTGDIEKAKEEIKTIIFRSGFFEKITKDKDVSGFTRLIVHYKGFSNEEGVVFIDLNKRAKLLLNPEEQRIKHFYSGFIPAFSLQTLSKAEMVAEKMAATICRNKPRDHYDLYKIIKAGIPIDISMVKEKCRQSGVEFNIIKMFNMAKKLKNRWDKDMIPLLAEEVSFQEVMQTLARHFKLKDEKDKIKSSRQKN